MAGRLVARREFLKNAGLTFAAMLSPARAQTLLQSDAVYASAYKDDSGAYGAALLAEDGTVVARVSLPARGHDVAHHPETGRAVAFARRPGTIAVAFDMAMQRRPQEITAQSGRHFYGHGVFSKDGRLLYASENDFENAAGVIGVYDVDAGFRRLGEFPSGGIGPHDMLLLNDGRTLAIANGGIETHPDFGRAKLNIATMAPCLCFVDRLHGTLVETQALPPALHKLSIRHLAGDGVGSLYFACQFEGAPIRQPPLFGQARPGETMRLFETDNGHLSKLKNYIGSIAANPQAGTLSVTSPRGNCLLVLDGKSGLVLSGRRLANVCGVTSHGDAYFTSTGNGVLFETRRGIVESDKLRLDNHLRRIAA